MSDVEKYKKSILGWFRKNEIECKKIIFRIKQSCHRKNKFLILNKEFVKVIEEQERQRELFSHYDFHFYDTGKLQRIIRIGNLGKENTVLLF